MATKLAANLLQVTLANGTTFTGTDTHPVWVENLDQWTAIGDLTPGDLVDTGDGLVEVSAITIPGYPADVYNIEVHGQHVYRITSTGVLVHNEYDEGGNGNNDSRRKDRENRRDKKKECGRRDIARPGQAPRNASGGTKAIAFCSMLLTSAV